MRVPRNLFAETDASVHSSMALALKFTPPPEQLQYFTSDFKTILSCHIEGVCSAMWLLNRWSEQSSIHRLPKENVRTKVSFLFLTQKLGSKATLWQAYGATTHCHQDKPGLLAFASLGWQQTSSWLALAARGKQESGLGMRLQWSGNEAAMVQQWGYSGPGMMLQWSWNEAAMVQQWGYSGLGMMLQWSWNDAAMVLEWGCNGLGIRLQWSGSETTLL